MALELEGTVLDDPFANASLFSLLPRTLKFTWDAELTADSDSQELESFRSFLKSMTRKASKEFLEQARAVKQISSKLLYLNTRDGDKVSVEDNDKGQPQVRRPALGRKRAQFSLKPLSRDPLPGVDIDSSIDLIEDPEEYFSVFEKLENADKELKKLRGEVPTDLVQRHQSAATRERRCGILGKTASYKHHFPVQGNAADGTIKSQEVTERTFSAQLSISANTVSTTNVQPEQIGESSLLVGCKANNNNLDDGSIGEKEKKIDHLLDELFSSFEGLDGNEEVAFLRERLQIKSIDVGKMCLPEMPGFEKNDLDAVTTMVSSSNLMVVNNVESRRKDKGSQLAKTSPILLSSPLAAISMLQRRIPLKSPVRNPYLMHPSDNIQYAWESFQSGDQGQHPLSPVELGHHATSGSIDDAASTPVSVRRKKWLKSDRKLQSPDSSALRVDIDLGTKIASEESPTVSFPSSLGRNDDCSPIGNNINEDVMPIECDSCLEDGNNLPMDASLPEQPEPRHEVLTSECLNHNNIDHLASQPGKRLGENADASPVIGFDVTTGGEVNHMSGGGDAISKIADHEGNSTGTQEVDLPMYDHSEDSCVIPEGNNEEQGPGADSKAPKRRVNKKPPPHKQKKTNAASRRCSLAEAGTSWDAGVRRSTRIRSRPLQYWCGERFLYGRIHDSLATVIGVKYASPSDSKLKVKSFVSDQYSDLVAQAALH